MIPATGPATSHVWKFRHVGGLDQVVLESAEDLQALPQLDQKLWVALSCPVKGLELDEKTLALIDTDNDGRILVPELLAAVSWALPRLKNPRDLLRGDRALPIDAILDSTPEGAALAASARAIVAQAKTPGLTAISIEEGSETGKIIAASALNGEGVVTPEMAADPATRGLIEDMLQTVGGTKDRAGRIGVDEKKVTLFFTALGAYHSWAAKAPGGDLTPLGAMTEQAHAALQAVRVKVDDYFARCRLARFDPRALLAVNRQESEYLAIAAKDLSISAAEIAGFPLARVEADRPLPLVGPVNPAWEAPLAAFRAAVVAPVLGGERTALTEAEWQALQARFAAYEKWLADKDGAIVEKLGPARTQALLAGPERAALASLLAADAALAGLARLTRYYRDLRPLLHNFVNFADFYSPDRLAAFQAGVLYLDSRACELCVRVEDPAAHALLATMSKAYIAYLELRRADEVRRIAACVTQGDSDYLFVGRNGIFYDRQGRDWHAVITKIIDNPISIREAFWSPYKKVLRMIEEQVAKRAAAADADTLADLNTGITTAATAVPAATPPPVPKRFDVGTVAALGVGVGALSSAVALITSKFVDVPAWKIGAALVALMLLISLPSMLIAWLKLRQRNLGPILEANGWAVNGRVRINLPFGTILTAAARLPKNARRTLSDPYADKSAERRRRWLLTLAILALVYLLGARVLGFWPFARVRVDAYDLPPGNSVER